MQSKSGTSRDLRPCAVDTDYATGLEAVRVGVFDISDVPPELVDRGEGGRHGGEEGEERPRHGEEGSLGDTEGPGEMAALSGREILGGGGDKIGGWAGRGGDSGRGILNGGIIADEEEDGGQTRNVQPKERAASGRPRNGLGRLGSTSIRRFI